ELGQREAVEIGLRIDAWRARKPDLDHALVADTDRPRRERVRVERHQRERRHRRMQDGSLCRERVCGRAGGRGDEDAVGAQRVDKFAVERELELDQPALRALADHRLVERDGAQHALAVALDLRVEERAFLDHVAAFENRAEAGAHVVVADVGHEAEPALVDADQRHAERHEIARGGEHRAVAAGDDREIGAFALGLHLAAALREKRANRLQRSVDFAAVRLADERDATESSHSAECTMIRMLDKRAQLLLKTLIERYIEEGQPVGSRTLSKHSGLDLSPATIRNVMSDLEELGFIASPHTSAGRIPTPAGYRCFVDTLLIIKELPSGDRSQLEDQLHPDNPQRVIQSASQLLSQLTQFAGVVMTPRRRAMTFKHLEFLRLSEKRVLLIVVTPEGDVQNRILFTERDYTPSELIEAANYVNQHY